MSLAPLWHRFDGPLDDTSAAALHLLEALGVGVAPGSVAGYITAHPAYPSLSSVVDCLDELGVRASARRTDLAGLSAAAKPVLIHVRDQDQGDAFWVVTGERAGGFTCRPPGQPVRVVPRDELAARFRGVVLSPVAGPRMGEREAARHARGDRLRGLRGSVAVALFLISLIGSMLAVGLGPRELRGLVGAHRVAGWLGLAASLYLSLRDLFDGSSWLGRLCRNGKAFNCTVVLGSRASRLWGVIPVADVGAAFFLAQVLAASAADLGGWTRPFFFLALVLGLCTLPVTIASIGLQAFVLRRLCGLCLTVQVLLPAQIALCWAAVGWDPAALASLDVRGALVLGAVALTAALGYATARPLVAPARAAPRLHHALETLRSAPEALERWFARAPQVSTDLPGKLAVGQPGAPLEILVVSHPFCVACAEAHAALERLIELFPRLVRGATVFSVTDEPRARSAARSLLLGHTPLSVWYAHVEAHAEDWVSRKEPAPVAMAAEDCLSSQSAFAQRLQLAGTPAVFVDGRPLPEGFGLRHLRFYLRAQERRRRADEEVGARAVGA